MNALQTIENVTQTISLLLTPPTLILAFYVIRVWGKRAWQASIESFSIRKCPAEHDLLIIGVVISFIGSFCDNLYWGIAWTTDFIQHPAKDSWFRWGVAANVPFRQTAGVIAGYLHVTAAGFLLLKRRGLLVLCMATGIIYVLTLYLINA